MCGRRIESAWSNGNHPDGAGVGGRFSVRATQALMTVTRRGTVTNVTAAVWFANSLVTISTPRSSANRTPKSCPEVIMLAAIAGHAGRRAGLRRLREGLRRADEALLRVKQRVIAETVNRQRRHREHDETSEKEPPCARRAELHELGPEQVNQGGPGAVGPVQGGAIKRRCHRIAAFPR
jgi:hypothetical protein